MFDGLKDKFVLIDFTGLPALIIALIAISVAGYLLWRLLPFLKNQLACYWVQWRIKKLGNKILSNVKLSDGVDGEVYIDHIVLRGNKVIVVDVKRYDGLIYGGEALDQWTQIVNQKSFQFSNPLLQNQSNVVAVKSIIPDVVVEGIVLFAGRSQFPRRVPDGVHVLRDIQRPLEKFELSEQVVLDWQKLCRHCA